MVLSKPLPTMVLIHLLFLWSLIAVQATHPSSNVPQPSVLRGRNLTASTVSTTECDNIRVEPYSAELQLLYEYSAEFEAGKSSSLAGLETAVAHAVALELDMCDELGRPLYKVKTNTRHTFSKTGTWKSAVVHCSILSALHSY